MTQPKDVQSFCDFVNKFLPERVDTSKLQESFADDETFSELLTIYTNALEPHQYSDIVISRDDLYLDHAYPLLGATFTPDVLHPLRNYRKNYGQVQAKPSTSVMIARRWHQYDSDGRLIYFNPDPWL